jgi:hypothetical protein
MGMVLVCGSLAADAEPWRFVVLGDTETPGSTTPGYNQTILGELRDVIPTESPDFVLVGGNLVAGGSATALQSWRDFFMAPLKDQGIAVYPCRGWCEASATASAPAIASATPWTTAFSGEYALPQNGPVGEKGITYSFEHKNATIVVWDQYSSGVLWGRVNVAWAEETCLSATTPHLFTLGNTDTGNTDYVILSRWGIEGYFHGYNCVFTHHKHSETASQYSCGSAGSHDLPDPGEAAANDVSELISSAGGYGYVLVEVDGYETTTVYKQRVAPGVYEAAVEPYTHSRAYLARPKAKFVANPQAGPGELDVLFQDQSTCPDGTISSWLWNFGDGATSTDRHPTHAYAAPGIYEITLRAANEYGSDTVSQVVFTGGQEVPVAGGLGISALLAAIALACLRRSGGA